MSSSDREKIDELITKVRGLGEKVNSTRAELGSPLIDRIFERVSRISAKLPAGNGNSHPQQQLPQPQEAKISCPKCGVQALQGSHFCSSCSFDFSAEARRQLKEGFEREKLERSARTGIIF